MSAAINNFIDSFISFYSSISQNLGPNFSEGFTVLIFGFFIAFFAYLIWKFYRGISSKNIIKLNLSRYNKSAHPILGKLIGIGLYFIEYLLIIPVLIFIWFAGLSIFLLLIAQGRNVDSVLLLSASMIAAVRILSYHSKEIAMDLAKLFPFITLSVFLLAPGAFSVVQFLEKIKEIPSIFGSLLIFLFAVFFMEIILRVFYTLYRLFYITDSSEEKQENKN